MHQIFWNTHILNETNSIKPIQFHTTQMAKLFAYFIFFLLFPIILRPEIHAVEARLLLKESKWQFTRRLSSSSDEVWPAESGPSPGAGHGSGPKQDRKRAVAVAANSSPNPGVGHGFNPKDITKPKSGPSPGEGHKHIPRAHSIHENKS